VWAGGTSRALAGWVAAWHAVVAAAMPWPQQRGVFRARGRPACGSGAGAAAAGPRHRGAGRGDPQGGRRGRGGPRHRQAVAAAVAAYAPADHDHWAPVAQDHGRRAPRARQGGRRDQALPRRPRRRRPPHHPRWAAPLTCQRPGRKPDGKARIIWRGIEVSTLARYRLGPNAQVRYACAGREGVALPDFDDAGNLPPGTMPRRGRRSLPTSATRPRAWH
jgi:hypothetical protein